MLVFFSAFCVAFCSIYVALDNISKWFAQRNQNFYNNKWKQKKTEMRALCSKTHFHWFFNFIFLISKLCKKNLCRILKTEKWIEKNVKSKIPTILKWQCLFFSSNSPPSYVGSSLHNLHRVFRVGKKIKLCSAIYLHEKHVQKKRNPKIRNAVTVFWGCFIRVLRWFWESRVYGK